MNQNDETYFACKKAFQEFGGKAELKSELQKIFTPTVQAQMAQQERIYHAQRPTEEALMRAKEAVWKIC